MQAPHRRPRRPRRRGAALLGFALVAAALVAASSPSGAATGQAEGLDVSHHQGTINWTKVATAGKRFAFIKATQGTAFQDPMYATNRAAATAVGIPNGAYHFADVTTSPSNADGAKAEADWFVSVAQPRAGDLPPVFDIETNGGLGQVALTDWAMTWLERVRQLTGIYPMIYTSPYGWNTRFGTSGNVVAESGYGLLWVAHWTTASSPTVPANNWANRGWTFWQYTSTGRVNGISGDVDLDRYKSTDVAPLLLRPLTITKVSVGGKFGGVKQDGLGGFCNATCSATDRLSVGGASTTLAPQSMDTGTTWTWGGDCAAAPVGGTCTLPMTTARNVTITYVPVTPVRLTVAVAGSGNGAVTSTPTGIACTATAGVASGTCAADFPLGGQVALAATASAGSVFTGWSGGGCTTAAACTVTVDAAKTVTATFQPQTFTLSLTRSGTGTGTISAPAVGGTSALTCTNSCSPTYATGTTVTLTPAAGANSRFVGWSGDCTGTSPCAPVMTADRSANAIFALLVARSLSVTSPTTIGLRKGQSVTVAGALTSGETTACPIGNQTVALWLATGTSAVATTRTTSGGLYSFSRKMNSVGSFTFVVKVAESTPTTLGNAICGGAVSPSVAVTVGA